MTATQSAAYAMMRCCQLVAATIWLSACTPAVAPHAPTMAGTYTPSEPDRTQPARMQPEQSRPDRARTPPTSSTAQVAASSADEAALTSPDMARGTAQAAGAVYTTRTGRITRSALDDVLRRGPGAFLRSIEITPYFRDNHFTGWQLVRVLSNSERLRTLDLRPGDVIVSVNDRRIVRPRHLQALWQQLRTAAAIELQVERDGQPFQVRVEITGAVDVPANTGP